jgi:hypothetical protein
VWRPAPAPIIRKRGTVVGAVATTATARGTRGNVGRITSTLPAPAATVLGRKSTVGAARGDLDHHGHITGRAVSMHAHDDIRRMRDDHELLTLL